MRAKEYLKSIQRLKNLIQDRQQQLAELHDQAAGVRGIDYSGVKVQSSPKDQMAEAMSRLVDLETEYINTIELYHRRRQQAAELINKLSKDIYVIVLTERYIKGKSFPQIAYEQNYAYGYVITSHGEALLEFNKLLETSDKI